MTHCAKHQLSNCWDCANPRMPREGGVERDGSAAMRDPYYGKTPIDRAVDALQAAVVALAEAEIAMGIESTV